MVGRPKNRTPSERITITGSPKLRQYLEDLVVEEGYGKTAPGVARTLIWRGIEELIAKGVLDRRRGLFEGGENDK